jgi:hypothetical protein
MMIAPSPTRTLTILFDEELPAGDYRLEVPSQGGLTDLAGWTPVAPGNPPGVLVSWTVGPSTAPGVPNNLGVLWPGTRITQTSDLAPGVAVTYRLVLIQPGMYKLETVIPTGSVAVSLSDGGGTTVLDATSQQPLKDDLVNLPTGVYRLQLRNVGTQPVQVQWTFRCEFVTGGIPDDGAGQSPPPSPTPVTSGDGSGNTPPPSPTPVTATGGGSDNTPSPSRAAVNSTVFGPVPDPSPAAAGGIAGAVTSADQGADARRHSAGHHHAVRRGELYHRRGDRAMPQPPASSGVHRVLRRDRSNGRERVGP